MTLNFLLLAAQRIIKAAYRSFYDHPAFDVFSRQLNLQVSPPIHLPPRYWLYQCHLLLKLILYNQ